MSKTRDQKKQIIEDLSDKFARQKAVVFVNLKGIPVVKLQELRKNLKREEIELKAVKKTLLKMVLNGKKIDLDVKQLEGELAMAVGYKDEVLPANLVYKFSKANKDLQILGGILDNIFIKDEMVISLAKLPSREQLLANLLGGMNAPMNGLVNALQGNLRNLVYVLSEINNK